VKPSFVEDMGLGSLAVEIAEEDNHLVEDKLVVGDNLVEDILVEGHLGVG
jgi:hypothetical protein